MYICVCIYIYIYIYIHIYIIYIYIHVFYITPLALYAQVCCVPFCFVCAVVHSAAIGIGIGLMEPGWG